MKIHLEWSVAAAVTPSPRVLEIAGMFGLGLDQERTLEIIPPIDLEITGGMVGFITGPSGSGKSSLLRLLAAQLRDRPGVRVLRLDRLPTPPDRPLVDGFADLPLDQVTNLLSRAGLNDAFVMLRRPEELSDGQRYRLALARAMAMADDAGGMAPARNVSGPQPGTILTVLLADEFGATLDRLTAAVIARNVRKWTRRQPHVCFFAATTQDDLLEPLEPDVLIEKRLGGEIEVMYASAPGHEDAAPLSPKEKGVKVLP